MTKLITLEQVQQLISNIQPMCKENGYYIALAGSCINKGYSTNDIDLVAVPRTGESKKLDLIRLLHDLDFIEIKKPRLKSRGRLIDVYHYSYNCNFDVDIAIVLGALDE